ncbi:Lsr2 dimerization domain-containing protein [Tsukamurella tyrosinosolvens]|uniref:Lsr2 family DNA-binding protein n=1 Tax=Tsukamurella tyrosinosolvens TaxID=57704 RepID=UPI000C7E974B|nr:histone-like nucleoid-structuring protein Lsr2 [Tsukamurella tyrosinosolvens]
MATRWEFCGSETVGLSGWQPHDDAFHASLPHAADPRTTIDREHTKAIRAWARSAGHAISERGRIPQAIVDAYNHSR